MGEIGRIDLCIGNGDLIDGRGKKSGGSENITSDMNEQADMAYEVLKAVDAKDYVLTYGTRYHVSEEGTDFENLIASRLGCDIQGHAFFSVDNVKFDVKHKVGSSQSGPHTRFTAIQRERLWAKLWSEVGGANHPDITIRSHVHYYGLSANRSGHGITTPALQLPGTKYGERECSGVIDVGLISILVDGNSYRIEPFFYPMYPSGIETKAF